MGTDLNTVLFPVEFREIFVEKEDSSQKRLIQETQYKPVANFKAVKDLDKDHVFAVVSNNYRLITNKEALEFTEPFLEQ
jgi:CRISPR/Cas system CSM-associated protein Csm4 (group 5 of RAMP superfamily)